MANSDKNIRITTSKNKTTYPNIVFTGSAAGSSVITLEVLDDNTLSFTSNEGQVFSIDSNLSTGTIWAVSDISGIPLLSASAGGTVGLGVYGGLVAIGQTNPIYKLDLKGSFGLASSNDSVYNFIFSNSAASGSNSLQIRSANSLLLYNSGNTFYTGFKSNAATNITYTLPTTDGASGQFLQTNGSAVLSWATATGSGGTGSTAGVGQGGQYEMAYYPGTGLSVIGSNTFTNNTATGVVSIIHTTVATNHTNGAFTVSGGVGIGGSLYVAGIGASITGVTFSNSTITRGTWNGTNISTTYGGTGQNLGSSSGVLTISSGTVSASTTSSAIASALSDETGSGSLVFNSQPSFGTGVTTGDATFAVFNTNATTINAFGAANIVNIAASTATGSTVALFGSNTSNYLLMNTGAGGVLRIQTDSATSRVRMFENMTTGTIGFFGTSGGTLYLGTDSGTNNGDIAIRGNFTSGGGGNVRAAVFTIATATSNGSGSGGTLQFQTSTSGPAGSVSNALRTRMRIEGAATGTSNFESIIIFGDDVAGSAFTSTLRGSNSSGTDISAGELIIQAARSTGTGTMAGICFNVASPGTTGSALNPVIDVGHFYSVQSSASTASGSLVIKGGIGITGNAFIGSTVTIQDTTASLSATSGALVISGGAGVGRTLSVGGSLNIYNGANYAGFRFTGTANTTYTLPTTSPAIGSSVLQSTAEGVMSWVPMVASSSSSGAGSGTVAIPGAQYQVAAYYHSASGASVSGSTTFTNNTATGIVNINHSTVSISSVTGALVVSGGVGIGGSIFSSTSVPSSISGVVLNNGIVSLGTWSGNFITSLYGGTGFNSYTIGDILVASTGTSLAKLPAGATNFVLTSNGTGTVPSWQAVPASAASSVAVSSTVVDAVFYPTVINSVSGSGLGLSTVNTIQINPARGTFAAVGISAGTAITVVGTAAAINTTTGALQVIGGVGIGGSLYAGGISNFSSNTASISSGTGALVVTNGVGIGGSLNVASASSISGVIFNTNYLSATGGTFTTILQAATIRALSGNTISFQTIDGTNAAQINNVRVAVLYSTISTSSGTGALVVSGGAGIGGSLYVASASQFESSVASIGVGSGAVVVTGGVGIGGSINVGGASRFSSSTTATSVGTGALTVTGGAGIAGSLYVGEASRFTSSVASINSGTGALTVTGGVGIGGSLNVASPSEFEATTAAIDVGSGALVVTGGVGIGGSLFVGGASRFTSSTTSISTGTGALTVTGGVGIGGSVFTSASVPSSISGVVLNNGIVTIGTWSGSFITSLYGGTGFNSYTVGDILVASTGTSLAKLPAGSQNFVLTSNGAGTVPSWQAVPSSSASSVAVITTTLDQVFYPTVVSTNTGSALGLSTVSTIQINPARGTFAAVGISAGTAITVVGTAAAINTTTGALQAIGGVGIGGSLYVAGASRFSSSIAAISNGTGALTVTGGAGIGGSLYVGDVSRFESNINSTTPGVGGLVATGGVGIGLSASIGGRLQMFNSSLYTAFVGAQSGVNTTYTLPTTSPATGSSVLQSTAGGVMSWVPMTSGGSASPGGVVDGSVQFKSGSSFGGTRGLYWNDLNKYLQVTGYAGGEPYVSSQAALLIEQTYGSFNGSANGNIIGANAVSGFTGSLIDLQLNAVTRFRVASTGAVTFANAFTFPTTDGSPNQVLQTNGSGSVSWATVTGSSGAGSGTVAVPGAQYQVAAYYHSATGASVSGSNTFTNNTATGVVEITHTTESTSTTSGAFQVDGGAGIAKSLFVGTTLSVGTTPSYNIPNNLASFVSTVDSYNQLVIQNKSSGTTASANLVVNNNLSTDNTNYGEIGMNSSNFSGTGALGATNAVYLAATSGPLVLGTTTSNPIRFAVNNGATDTIYIHEAGSAISVFTNLDLRTQNDVRFFNSGNTFFTAIQAANNTASYTLSLPAAPVGNGYSTILVDTSGNMFFAPLEGGLATTSVTGNRVVLRNKMEHHVWMTAGYTPLAAGPDNVTYLIPDSSEDGATKLTFILTEFNVRVETPSAGSSRIQLERSSTDTGAFTLAATGSSLIGGSGLTLSGAGIYVTTTNTFVAGTFVTSGNLLRLNFNLLNATHANFSVNFTLNEV